MNLSFSQLAKVFDENCARDIQYVEAAIEKNDHETIKNISEKYELETSDFEDAEDALFMIFREVSQEYGFAESIDWSGEFENELGVFVSEVLSRLSIAINLDEKLEEWEKSLDWDALGRGEYIQRKFFFIGELLIPHDLHLTFLETQGDDYIVMVLTEQQKAELSSYYDDSNNHFLFDHSYFENVERIDFTELKDAIRSKLSSSPEFQNSIKNLQQTVINQAVNEYDKELAKYYRFWSLRNIWLILGMLFCAIVVIWDVWLIYTGWQIKGSELPSRFYVDYCLSALLYSYLGWNLIKDFKEKKVGFIYQGVKIRGMLTAAASNKSTPQFVDWVKMVAVGFFVQNVNIIVVSLLFLYTWYIKGVNQYFM